MDTQGPNLLMSMGLDLSPVKSAADVIKTTLENLNALSAQVQATAAGAAKAQSTEMGQLKTQAQAAVLAAKAAIAEENTKTAALKGQTAELVRQQAEQKAATAAATAGVAAAKEKAAWATAETAQLKTQTAELAKQSAELRLQTLQRRQEAAAAQRESGGGAGVFGSLGQSVSRGLLGRGMAGQVAGGLLAGVGIASMIELAGQSIERFLEKLREVTVESGKLTILQDIFHGLATGAGLDATVMLQKMTDATEGLVSRTTLLKAANTELRSPLKLTQDQIVQLMGDVTKLSEAAGNTAEQGIQRLNMAFLRGRPMILSTVLGVQGLRDIMRDVPPGMSAAARSTIIWQKAIAMLHDQATKMGDIPQTLEQMQTRLHNTMQNLLTSFGQGFGQSAGLQQFIRDISAVGREMGGWENTARRMGAALGSVFADLGKAIRFVVDNLDTMKKIAEDFIGIGLALVLTQIGKSALVMGAQFLTAAADMDVAATATSGLTKALAGLRAVAASIATALAALAGFAFFKGFAAWKDELTAVHGKTVEWGDMLKGVLVTLGQIVALFENPLRAGFISSPAQNILDAQQERLRKEHERALLSPTGNQRTYGSEAEAAAAQFFPGMIGANQPPGGETPQQRMKEAQALMQERIAQAKLALEEKKTQIAAEKEVDQEKYKYEQESLEDHYANLRKIAQDNFAAQQTEAAENWEAQKAELDARKQNSGMTQAEYQAHLNTITMQFHHQTEANELAHQQAMQQIDDEGNKDRQEARQRAIQGQLKEQEDDINRTMRRLQAGLQQGELDPDAYYAKQITLTQQLAEAKIAAANRIYQNGSQNEAALQTRANAINAALDEAQAKYEQMTAAEAQVRLQYVERMYQPRQSAIQAQLGGLRPGENPVQLQQQMADLLQKEREELERQIESLPQFSDGWNQVYSKIESIYQMQQKYNDELRKSQDLLQPVADSLSSITKLLGSVWTSHFVQGLSAGMRGGIESIRGAVQAGTTIRNAFTGGSLEAQKDPHMVALENAADSAGNSFGTMKSATSTAADALNSFTNSVNQAMNALTNYASGSASTASTVAGGAVMSLSGVQGATGPLSANVLNPSQLMQLQTADVAQLDLGGISGPSTTATSDLKTQNTPGNAVASFTAGLTAAIGELSNFADALTKSTSGLGGAISGGAAGAGMGQMLSSALGMAGPWGMVAGAGVGMISGMISGEKNAQISREMSELNRQYTSIMDAFHSNTNNLQEAILQMQELIAQAQVDEANSKKGGSQFASLISQYSQQLIQLQDQQKSIVSQMEVQLAIFSTPTGMQQFLTNLQQIIEQYDKFAGAAKNASQLAQANSWLTDSLSSYTTQMENSFIQDEENAIQDALNLNSLISERSTLISNLNNSIINVLEQGVLTRQQTMSQKKGQQIYQLESQASQQLNSINNEISLEQYKVGIETSLFNLAMTSMGLQAQLLSLQEGQASQSLAAIQALQQLIAALQNGSYNFGSISSILSSLGYSSAAGNIPSSGLSTVGSEVASTNAMDALIAAAYQSRATLGYGAFRGQTL